MPPRILKIDMMDAISIYFRNIGEYGPYLDEKSTKRELENIIRQYNINMDILLIEVAIERAAEKERRAKEQEDLQMKIRNMTDEQRQKFNEYIEHRLANPFAV
jgi:topoisomerase IA-like protein